MKYVFKTAGTERDLEGIRRLNHRIFAEEIRQHAPTDDGRLIDPRESLSRFTIALCNGEVVGMVAVSSQCPFSVEKRLPRPEAIESLGRLPLEVRLLAIAPEHRNGMVMAGLLGRMVLTAMEQGHDVLLISGVEERADLYERLGFRKLGPPVPEGNSRFFPMALKLDDLPETIRRDIARYRRRSSALSPRGTSAEPPPPPGSLPGP